ncbi:MAG TPA: glycosyltransferase [Rhizomicrobium sp.]|jgi:glycosyltransferase involved in cell wall biosynthesis
MSATSASFESGADDIRIRQFGPGLAQTFSTASASAGHIAIVLHDLRGGGAERAVLRLARGMVAAGRQVELILVRGDGAYLDEIPPGVGLKVLGRPRVSQSIGALAKHFRRTGPRAVLSALTHMNLATVAATRLSRMPFRLVISERNQISSKAREAVGVWQKMLYRAVPHIYRAADAIVAVSGGVAADLANFGRLSKKKIRVIHNPVFDSDVEVRAQAPLTHPWFERKGPPIILAAGRLHRQKGFDILLEAFAITRAQVDCRLVILGEGPERGALLASSERLGLAYDIDMPGFLDNPFPLMARAGAFVLSSRWEGFPNALVEAMACGAPVIATDCPSGPREILGGGRYGTLVTPENPQALGRALIATLTALPDTQISQTRAQSFSVAAAAAQYLDVLEG